MGYKIPIDFYFDGKYYKAEILPTQTKRVSAAYQVFLNEKFCGVLSYRENRWESNSPYCHVLADAIGNRLIDLF